MKKRGLRTRPLFSSGFFSLKVKSVFAGSDRAFTSDEVLQQSGIEHRFKDRVVNACRRLFLEGFLDRSPVKLAGSFESTCYLYARKGLLDTAIWERWIGESPKPIGQALRYLESYRRVCKANALCSQFNIPDWEFERFFTDYLIRWGRVRHRFEKGYGLFVWSSQLADEAVIQRDIDELKKTVVTETHRKSMEKGLRFEDEVCVNLKELLGLKFGASLELVRGMRHRFGEEQIVPDFVIKVTFVKGLRELWIPGEVKSFVIDRGDVAVITEHYRRLQAYRYSPVYIVAEGFTKECFKLASALNTVLLTPNLIENELEQLKGKKKT